MNFEIKNVFLTIEGKSIVNDVSIKVCPGEIVGLMGPNGAGKTSTFNLAVGNLKPDKGDILINNKSIKNLPFIPIKCIPYIFKSIMSFIPFLIIKELSLIHI